MSKPQTQIVNLAAKSYVPENESWIRIIVTSPTLDRDFEVIDTASLRIPVKPKGWKYARDLTPEDQIDIPFLYDHEWSVEKQLGSVRSMYMNADGELEAIAGFTSLQRGQDAYTLAKENHLGNSFSATFNYGTGYLQDGVYYDSEVVELSMVFKGSNRDARVLEVSKRFKIEGDDVADTNLEDEQVQPSQDNPEADKPLESVAEAVEETPTPAVEPTPAATVEDQPVEEGSDEPEVPNDPQPKATKPKKEADMSAEDKIITKQVQDTPEPEVLDQPVVKKASKRAQRELFVKQFIAYKTKNTSLLKELNHKAMEMDGVKSKAISYDDASALYQTEVVSTDILTEYQNLATLNVNRVDILGATQWKRIVEASGNGFQPVGIEESKQEDKPTWTPLTVLPKEHALIVAWYDAIARETPIAVYQQIVRYIANEYNKLEQKIVLSFAGTTTTGGDTFAATGLVPLLTTAGNRTVNIATFGAADMAAGLGRAYGMLETDREVTLVANRKTWGQMATVVNTQGNTVFNTVGQQVAAGALGTFNVVISQEVPNGLVVVGAMSDYDLVTRGGLETLFSREATVGSLNLFTDDASAVRACVDIAGKPARLESFVLIDFVPNVS